MANVRTIGMRKINVTVTTAGTRVPISSTTLFATDFEVFPLNANAGANMYVGNVTVDNTWIPRPKNFPVNFVHGTGVFSGEDQVMAFDLSKIYLDSDSNGDIARVQYLTIDPKS